MRSAPVLAVLAALAPGARSAVRAAPGRALEPPKALAAALPPAQSTPQDERRWIETFVPRLESPGAQLAHARRLRRNLDGARDEERAFWRKLAVEAYQAVGLFHPGAKEAAEAAFRAGELLRAGGEEARALAEFENAVQHGAGTEFRARARLEIGHLHRKNERWRAALDRYLEVTADTAADTVRRDDAWFWAGVVWQAQGNQGEALAAWRRVAEHGVDALDRIHAFDSIALSYLELGDLEAAAGVLDECLGALSASALEETSAGERVRNALLRMRVVDELPRAIARKNRYSSDEGSPRNP